MSTLIEMVQWQGFNGWEGVKCGKCDATHNVMIGGGVILCERCGACIVKSWSHHRFCYRKPDFGWGRCVLGWATRNFGRYKDYLKDTEKSIERLKHETRNKSKRRNKRSQHCLS